MPAAASSTPAPPGPLSRSLKTRPQRNVDKLVCVTALADDLKAKHQEMKRARHAGRTEEAAAALGDVVAAADTLRKVRHVR